MRKVETAKVRTTKKTWDPYIIIKAGPRPRPAVAVSRSWGSIICSFGVCLGAISCYFGGCIRAMSCHFGSVVGPLILVELGSCFSYPLVWSPKSDLQSGPSCPYVSILANMPDQMKEIRLRNSAFFSKS